jgi:hypothetical protein
MMHFETKIFKGIWIHIFIILILTSPLYAQSDFSFTYYIISDDNSFKNRNLYDEWINTFSLYTGYTFSGNPFLLRLYYTGDYSTFTNYKERENNAHIFGIAGIPFKSEDITINLGASAKIRRNKSNYTYYDINSYSFYANFLYEPQLTKIYTLGFNLQKNKFLEFSQIDNIEYRLWGRYQQFFQNKLSLMGDIGIGVKNYVNQKKMSFFGYVPGLIMPRARYVEEPINVLLFSSSINIGKSLTPKTGVNLNVGGQLFISDPIESFLDGVYYYTENDLYDDPYSYQNLYSNMNITRVFGIGFQGKIGVEYQKKNYKGTPALTNEGNASGNYRKDTRIDYSLLLTKTFLTDWKFPNTFDLFFRFLIRDNASNDPYYDYFDHLGMVGITIGFKSF